MQLCSDNHEQRPGYNLNGNIEDFDRFEGVIHDYQTTSPQLILTCDGYFAGGGVGAIYIPIKYCPECGRKLGVGGNEAEGENDMRTKTMKAK